MSAGLIQIGMMGLGVFDAYQQVSAGNDAQRKYNEMAAEEYRQAGYLQRESLEEQHDLTKQGRTATGDIIARAAKSGLRVSGSTKTRVQRKLADIERRKAMSGFRASEGMRRHYIRADQYRSAGRSARVTGQRRAIGSLLTSGYAVGKYRYEKGQWPFNK